MAAYPEPNILPREQADKAEAAVLSAIIPCILEQIKFESTYSEAMWQKLKTGTACYRVSWDGEKHGGLGDIAIRYGYHRYEYDIMIATIILLVVIVQIIQCLFNAFAKKIDKRIIK